MKKALLFLLSFMAVVMFSCSQNAGEGSKGTSSGGEVKIEKEYPPFIGSGSREMIFVKGGSFTKKVNGVDTTVSVDSFYMSRYEGVRNWISTSKTDDGDETTHKVGCLYTAIYLCNSLSIREGLEPYYLYDGGTKLPDVIYMVNPKLLTANKKGGYRLPTVEEWQWAAMGGVKSKGYAYAGSNDIEDVAFYNGNSSEPQKIGLKKPNELGFYDMSGNYSEFSYTQINRINEPQYFMGGSFAHDSDFCKVDSTPEVIYMGEIDYKGALRLVRDIID